MGVVDNELVTDDGPPEILNDDGLLLMVLY